MKFSLLLNDMFLRALPPSGGHVATIKLVAIKKAPAITQVMVATHTVAPQFHLIPPNRSHHQSIEDPRLSHTLGIAGNERNVSRDL